MATPRPSASPASGRGNNRDPNRRNNNDPKTTPNSILTNFQKHKQRIDSLREKAGRANRAGRAFVDAEQLRKVSPLIVDHINKAGTQESEEKAPQQLAYGRPMSPEDDNPATGQSDTKPNEDDDPILIRRAKDLAKNHAAAKGKELAFEEAGLKAIQQGAAQAARQAARQATRRAAVRLTASLLALTNPYVLGAIAIIGGVLITLFLLVAIIGMNGDVSASGTTPTVAFSSVPSADLTELKKTVGGEIDTAAKAEKVIAAVQELRGGLSNNPAALRMLDDIEKAARVIIEADPADTKTIKDQQEIIKSRLKDLDELVGINFGDCRGANPCLDVEPVTQQAGSHCGEASAIMVLIYNNKGHGTTYFNESEYVKIEGGLKKNSTPLFTCLSAGQINRLSPPDRRGWDWKGWKQAPVSGSAEQKRFLVQAIINSLNGNDPVIMYFDPGGTASGKHIVVAVGYDSQDDGGTFLINNPSAKKTVVKTRESFTGDKLTASHLMRTLSGGGGGAYNHSVLIRDKYWR